MDNRFAAAVARANVQGRLPARAASTQAQMAHGNSPDAKTPDPPMTIAHLLNTAVNAAGHVDRHLAFAHKTEGADQKYNLDHATKHMEDLQDHLHRGVATLNANYPDIGSEYQKLDQVANLQPGTQAKS